MVSISKRELAIKHGADYAFDPYPTFVHSFVTNQIKYCTSSNNKDYEGINIILKQVGEIGH